MNLALVKSSTHIHTIIVIVYLMLHTAPRPFRPQEPYAAPTPPSSSLAVTAAAAAGPSSSTTSLVVVSGPSKTTTASPAGTVVVSPDSSPLLHWSHEGSLEFVDYRMRYREGTPEVLKGISLTIRPGEKIGVAGRSGAGKSSLMVALFRLISNDCHSGTIKLGGVDIDTLGLDELVRVYASKRVRNSIVRCVAGDMLAYMRIHDILVYCECYRVSSFTRHLSSPLLLWLLLQRRALAIIPQDPVLFSGTVRSNLDPVGEVTHGGDAPLWDVLEKVRNSYSPPLRSLLKSIKNPFPPSPSPSVPSMTACTYYYYSARVPSPAACAPPY